jgi:hypothetical protein
MATKHRQGGLSILGFLFVSAVLVVAVMIGFRVAPPIIEYYSVKQALSDSLREISDPGSAIPDVRRSFQKRADAGYIDSVRGADIEVTRNNNIVTASVAWTRRLHLVANASLLLEFEATATR